MKPPKPILALVLALLGCLVALPAATPATALQLPIEVEFDEGEETGGEGETEGEEEAEEGEEEEFEVSEGTIYLPAECLLRSAEPQVTVQPHAVRLGVHYSADAAVKLEISYWLKGGKGSLQ